MSLLAFLENKVKALAHLIEEGAGDVKREIVEHVEDDLHEVQEDVMDFLGKLQAEAQENPEMVFSKLRKIKPILVIKSKKLAVVTRFDDVQEILSRDNVFLVTYETKMRDITGGSNFFLGMQDTATYQRDVSNMRVVVARDDIPEKVIPFVEQEAEKIVAASDGRMNTVGELTKRVPARLVGSYFGTPGDDEDQFIADNTLMFQYLFTDLNNDPKLKVRTLEAARRVTGYLDRVVQERKADPPDSDDVVDRCLRMQEAGTPGMDDAHIRNNLVGLIIGAIPTTSKCCAHVLDVLLDRPKELAGAQAAARAGDDELVKKYVLEALRFKPHNPGTFRLTGEDYKVAKGSMRATTIPKGTTVLAATQSGMFDSLYVDDPEEFRIDRPPYNYMHWGYSLHECFGKYINEAQIPRILTPLFKRTNLRRAAGDAGKLVNEGPFPSSLVVEFD